jgi:hypothetical protein
MASLHRMSACVLVTLLLASPAWAQRTAPQASPPDDWGHGTTVSASVGVATDQSDTGGLAGGALGWELSPRVMVEGSGLWLDRPGGSHGFNAALKVRAGLTRTGVSPFVEGGVGLYRLTTDTSGEMPEFYHRRMASQGASLSQRSFTDPVFHIGAGVNVFTSRHLSLQPAAEVLLVTRDGHTYTLAAFSLRLAYHFEDHPVTR